MYAAMNQQQQQKRVDSTHKSIVSTTTNAANTPITNGGMTSNSALTATAAKDDDTTTTKNKSSGGDETYNFIEKAIEINQVLNEPEIDLWRLREFALTEGGLINGTFDSKKNPNIHGLKHIHFTHTEDKQQQQE